MSTLIPLDGELKSDSNITGGLVVVESSRDEHEARAVKYAIARIVRLSSGRFALFSPFVNRNDVDDLMRIGTLEEIGPLIPDYEQVQNWHPQTEPSRVKKILAELDLSDLEF